MSCRRREVVHGSHDGRVGRRQECLSRARSRRERPDCVDAAAATRTGRRVLCESIGLRDWDRGHAGCSPVLDPSRPPRARAFVEARTQPDPRPHTDLWLEPMLPIEPPRAADGLRPRESSRSHTVVRRRAHAPSRVTMAEKELAWETKVARKTRTKASNNG